MEQLLNALGHDSFRSLSNRGTHWELLHKAIHGGGISSITDKHLDRLLETWQRVVGQIDETTA